MKRTPIASLIVTALTLATAAMAQDASQVLNQLKGAAPESARDGATHVSTVAGAPAAAGPELEYYQSYKGTMRVNGQKHDICFGLSPRKIDRYAGDVDMSQGVYVYQEINPFQEDGAACGSALEHTGGYIPTCSGLFLVGKDPLAGGEVFTRLDRYNPSTAELAVKPIGSYNLRPVAGCGEQGPRAIKVVDTVNKTTEVFTITSEGQGTSTVYRIKGEASHDEKTVIKGDREPIDPVGAGGSVPHPTTHELLNRYREAALQLSRIGKYTTPNGQLILTVEPGGACSPMDAALLMFWIDEFFYFG